MLFKRLITVKSTRSKPIVFNPIETCNSSRCSRAFRALHHHRSIGQTSSDKTPSWSLNHAYLASAVFASVLSYNTLMKNSENENKEFSCLSTNFTRAEQALRHIQDDMKTIINWSGTHTVELLEKNYFEPETLTELEDIVRNAHEKGSSVRPVGSALSPNGIAFNEAGMISMAHMDEIIHVDEENMTVTVQAGARVSQVIDELRKYNLTLPNLASIAEQQMGGFIQVGAHGTGARIPPVDDFVTKLKIVTPGCGTIELEKYQNDGETVCPLFLLARVGLGCLGIVAEVTMKCIPAHQLIEHTFVLTRDQAKQRLPELLKNHKHMRYMWIPYEDAVVVVTNDPVVEGDASDPELVELYDALRCSREDQFEPLTNLLIELHPDKYTRQNLSDVGFGEIRDAVLAVNPLDVSHVKRCNKAEAEFWRRSEGFQIKPSDQLLQFDCGGEQWVWEICFPTGTYSDKNLNDMTFMSDLLDNIEKQGIPAHTPIEQRWSASSSSFLSPAHGCDDGLHCWVGIIMYLPSDEKSQRDSITRAFKDEYCSLMRRVGDSYSAASHWAKLELPHNDKDINALRENINANYPVALFNKARRIFDPKGILSNPLIDIAFSSSNNARSSSD